MSFQRAVPVVLVILLVGPATGVVVADENASVDEETLRIEHEYAQHDERGLATVTLTYRVGDAFTGFRTRLAGNVSVADTHGISVERDDGVRWLVWDGRSERPTATLHVPVNETSDRFGGYSAYDGGDWALLTPLGLYTRYTWTGRNVDATLERTREVAGEGVASSGYVYLGPNEQYTRTVNGETIRLVVPAAATLDDPRARLDALAFGARRLDVGANHSEAVSTDGVEVTAIAAPAPLRIGQARGSDFFARANASVETWLHEYTHTRQTYRTADGTRWTREAFAEYYGRVLAWEYAQSYDYRRVQSLYERGHRDTSVLSRPTTWSATTDYHRGGAVLAALDARLRNETDNETTVQAVLGGLNDRAGRLGNGTVREAATAAAGTSMERFFASYVYGRQPPPTAGYLAARGIRADLAVTTTARNGSVGEVDVTITNDGPVVARTPRLSVDAPTAFAVTARGTSLSNRSIALDDLDADESRTVTVSVYAPLDERVEERVAVTVGGTSGDEVNASVPLAYGTVGTPTQTASGTATPTVTTTPTATQTPARSTTSTAPTVTDQTPAMTATARTPATTDGSSDADEDDDRLAGLGIIVGLGIAGLGCVTAVCNALLGVVWRSVVSYRTLGFTVAGGLAIALAAVAAVVF